VMINNARIADLIREARPEEIHDAIEEGGFFEMQTFSKALIDLVVAAEVDRELAANASSNKHDFLVALERALKQQVADQREAEEPEPPPAGGPLRTVEAPVGETSPGLRVAHPEPT
jgi:Tfp pilus assembly ATPase PilU